MRPATVLGQNNIPIQRRTYSKVFFKSQTVRARNSGVMMYNRDRQNQTPPLEILGK